MKFVVTSSDSNTMMISIKTDAAYSCSAQGLVFKDRSCMEGSGTYSDTRDYTLYTSTLLIQSYTRNGEARTGYVGHLVWFLTNPSKLTEGGTTPFAWFVPNNDAKGDHATDVQASVSTQQLNLKGSLVKVWVITYTGQRLGSYRNGVGVYSVGPETDSYQYDPFHGILLGASYSWKLDGAEPEGGGSWTESMLENQQFVDSSLTFTPTATVSLQPSTSMVASTSSTATEAALTAQPFPVLPVAGAIVAIAAVAGILVMRRKKPTEIQRLQQLAVEHPTMSSQPGISTGFSELDQLLGGGLPEGYSILFLSASWDERDLLIRRIVRSWITAGKPVFYLSKDVSTTQDLVQAYSRDFYAFSEQADMMKSDHGNLFKIPGIGNLSEFSISLGVALKDAHVAPGTSKLLVVDVTSDILLRHKSLTTLRWLSDFVAKRKPEKFTILATLNPLIAPKEETQPIVDLFDGVIQIYEKELAERARRFIVIKKMRGRRYIETDLMLDRNRLF